MQLKRFTCCLALSCLALSCLALSGFAVACTSVDSGESDDDAAAMAGVGAGGAGDAGGSSANGTSVGGAISGAGGSSAQGGSAAGGDGQGGSGEQICSWSLFNNGCGAGMYCDAPACAAGVCKAVGAIEDPKKSVVCGCDGANYWNASMAAVFGMPVQANTACATPTICGTITNMQCPKPGHHCAKALPNMQACSTVSKGGNCWGMPQVCGSKGSHRLCDDKFCQSECAVIKSGKTYYLDSLTCK